MVDLQAVYKQAVDEENAGNYPKAIELYDQVLQAKPLLAAQLLYHKGACFYRAEEYDKSFDNLVASIKQGGDIGDAYYFKGKIHEKRGEFEDAAEMYEKARDKGTTANIYASLAHCYNQAGQFERALDVAGKGLHAGSSDPVGLHNERIFAFFKTDRALDCIEDVESVLRIQPVANLRPEQLELYSNVFMHRGQTYMQEGKLEDAHKFLKRADDLSSSPDSLFLLGVCLLRLGRDEESKNVLEAAVKANPGNWRYHVALGTVYLRMPGAHFEEAAHHFGIALKDPRAQEDTNIHYNNGIALMNLGREKEAKPSLQKVYEKDKQKWTGSALLGNIMLNDKEYEQAIPVYISAIDNSNGKADDTIYHNLGYAYMMCQRFKEAMEMFEEALKRNPKNTGAKSAAELARAKWEEQERERIAAEKAEEDRRRADEAVREAQAREKAAKDAAAKKKAHEERLAAEKAAKEAAEEQKRIKAQEAKERRERRIAELRVLLGEPQKARARRPSLDLIPQGNTGKHAYEYADWYNKEVAHIEDESKP